MTTIRMRGRLAIVATLAAAAIGSAAPAQADAEPKNCDTGVERLEQRFREIEEQRGYEAATKWWYVHWHAYYERCLAP
jgi:hypothetical protein